MSSKNAVSIFIQKLWTLLESYRKQQDIICWTDSGNSFAIKDKKKFCQRLLPIYFRHSKFTSFVRQLNRYNFRKVKSAKFQYEFQHQLFRQDHKELLVGIKRKPTESDLNFGKDLIKNMGNKIFENSLISQSKGLISSEIKVQTEAQNEFLTYEQLAVQNLKLKEQSVQLNQNVRQLSIQWQNSVLKIQLLFECFESFQIPVTANNFSFKQFMRHFSSDEMPFHSSSDYSVFFERNMIQNMNSNFFWQIPIMIPANQNLFFK